MEVQNVNINKVRSISAWILLLSGLTILFCASLILGTGLYLDFFGGEAVGQITNKLQPVSNDSGRSFNPVVTFTANDGQEISFTPLQKRARYQLSKFLRTGDLMSYFLTRDVVFSGDLLETIDTSVEVSYLEMYPQIAKINFTYHIEYYGQIAWVFWGLLITSIGLLIRRGNSKVIDLRKNKAAETLQWNK